MVPLVYVLITVFQVQRAAFGVTEAARQAGRAYVTTTVGDPASRAQAAADLAMRDQVPDAGPASVSYPAGAPALVPGQTVTVQVAHDVTLPILGGLFGEVEPTIPVKATHVEVVDAFREAP
jgi:hypothetical protein